MIFSRKCLICPTCFTPAQDHFQLCEACASKAICSGKTVKAVLDTVKAKKSRALANFYGGKALKGSAEQKKLAEQIREGVLESTQLSDDNKQTLLQTGGFTENSKFWIDNKDVKPGCFTAENIVKEYRGMVELEEIHYKDIVRSNYVSKIEAAVNAIVEYMQGCDFNFASHIERVQNEIEKRAKKNTTTRRLGRR